MLTTVFLFFALVGLFCPPTWSAAVLRNSKTYRQAIEPPVHLVLGVRGLGIDTTQPRLEIRELERNQDQFNVYLLGLRRLQSIPQNDKFSYYQIAGIHGRPYIPWDNVQKHPNGSNGYCAHGSNLFPTWHRPYLGLVEQSLYYNAQQAVSEFPFGEARDRMYNALNTFRMPYWDAAAIPPEGTSSFPAIVQERMVEIEVPSGETTAKMSVPNPLYAYTFHPLPVEDLRDEEAAGKDPWILWDATKRYPTSMNGSAQSQNNLVAQSLDKNRMNLMQRTYQMLGMQEKYLDISNSMVDSEAQGGIPDSLESVHDTLHNAISRGGHMYDAAYSAFDPIFWLLHTNVDRLLAIWQGLHPDSFIESHVNPWPTFTTPSFSQADENTSLYPFHRNTAGEFWTSASVRNHTVFGSTYPEFLGLSATDTLVGRVNALYGGNATSRLSWETTRTDVYIASLQGGNVQYQYSADIRVQHMGPGGVFKVFVFLGGSMKVSDESLDNQRWMSEPRFVGYAGFQNVISGKKDILRITTRKTSGAVALTLALEDRMRTGELRSMDETVVGAYLQKKLHWLLVDADDNVVSPENAPGFSIGVSWAKITPATASTLPKVLSSGFKQLPHATMGKAGKVK